MNAEQILKEHGLHASHWGKRIIAAEQKDVFNSDDVEDSSRWVTCACGKITQSIPRVGMSNAPKDERLLSLGEAFYEGILEQEYILVAKTLINIEKRAIEVAKGE